jgi:putative oxidoreductase
MTHLARLIVRVTVGGLLAGHGAQKLFGWFGGRGIEGTEQWLGSMGLQPARPWALTAGSSEFLGGLFTALGFLNPIGPLLAIGSMVMATVKVHLGRPIWATEGGAELPVVNMAALSAIALAGPGAISADRLLGIRTSRRLLVVGVAAIVGLVGYAMREEAAAEEVMPDAADTQAGLELQAGGATESTTIEPEPVPATTA